MNIYSLNDWNLVKIGREKRFSELANDIGKASWNTLWLSYCTEFVQHFVLSTMVFKAYKFSAGLFIIVASEDVSCSYTTLRGFKYGPEKTPYLDTFHGVILS